MTVGIVGLGLIGGSFAKAYFEKGHTVFVCDTDRSVLEFSKISGTVSSELANENIKSCDLILICIYPEAAVKWFEAAAPFIAKETVVIDCCGTKRVVCSACFSTANKYGLTYLGGHPMAGTHKSGFKYAKADMFIGAPMVIVPPDFDNIDLLSKVKDLLSPAGFGHISVTTADKHDEMIAFTSQMAHVVSNAYIKSPTAHSHQGFSAGSYKDMTRVAKLNPNMWAELFLENKDYLINELDILISNLNEYKQAMAADDLPQLTKLLDEGSKLKEEVDGK